VLPSTFVRLVHLEWDFLVKCRLSCVIYEWIGSVCYTNLNIFLACNDDMPKGLPVPFESNWC
jgi:hypothetical protein